MFRFAAAVFYFPALLLAQTPASAPKVIFVTPEQVDATLILPSPAPAGSWQFLEEIAELHRLEQTRTPEQIAHAQADDKEESIFLFADILGPKFNRASLPHTALLSDHVKGNESVIVNPGKKFFRRPRPYHFDATIHTICKATENREDFSYPSGHGTTGYLEGLVLAMMLPEKRDAIFARADDYAHSREVCGAHYSSDEAASKAIAYAMIGVMANHLQFKAELEAARTELRAELGFTPALSAQSK
jgi:acid phosphatase (class A)